MKSKIQTKQIPDNIPELQTLVLDLNKLFLYRFFELTLTMRLIAFKLGYKWV